MKAIIIIDAQNEFSGEGKRPIPDFKKAIGNINEMVSQARKDKIPIAWVRHFNKPGESEAFIPNSWGAAFHEGMGPMPDTSLEMEFQKDVYGAFTGTQIHEWLNRLKVDEILLAGFFTHGCVSTTAREGLMLGYKIVIKNNATASFDIAHEKLGNLSASEVKRSALLHLNQMGASIIP